MIHCQLKMLSDVYGPCYLSEPQGVMMILPHCCQSILSMNSMICVSHEYSQIQLWNFILNAIPLPKMAPVTIFQLKNKCSDYKTDIILQFFSEQRRMTANLISEIPYQISQMRQKNFSFNPFHWLASFIYVTRRYVYHQWS